MRLGCAVLVADQRRGFLEPLRIGAGNANPGVYGRDEEPDAEERQAASIPGPRERSQAMMAARSALIIGSSVMPKYVMLPSIDDLQREWARRLAEAVPEQSGA